MNLVESDSPLLDELLPSLVHYILSDNFMLNPKLNTNYKECGLDFIGVIAENKKSVLTNDTNVLERFI